MAVRFHHDNKLFDGLVKINFILFSLLMCYEIEITLKMFSQYGNTLGIITMDIYFLLYMHLSYIYILVKSSNHFQQSILKGKRECRDNGKTKERTSGEDVLSFIFFPHSTFSEFSILQTLLFDVLSWSKYFQTGLAFGLPVDIADITVVSTS